MIRVEPVTVPWAEALIEGDDVFAERFSIPVAPGWSGFSEVVAILRGVVTGNTQPPWGPYVFFEDGVLVGNGGWKGPPAQGAAELGYNVAPQRRNRGVATTAVRLLIDDARASGLRLAVAHTLAAESPSTAVLSRCGLTKVAEIVDFEAGTVWRWELQLDRT